MQPETTLYNFNNTPIEPADGEIVESFYVNIPKDHVAMANSGEFIVPPTPPGIPNFTEPAIQRGLAVLAKVRDGSGEVVGFASELEVFPDDGLERDDAAWDTHWTILLPGRGTVFLHQIECTPESGPMIMRPVMETKKDWVGDVTFVTSVGPLANGRGRIAGGTGEFEEITGSFVEIARTTKFTAAGEMHLTPIELRLFKENV
jgi:hypothetical protein|tara:strand:- start:113 stop:721 length:609 start_codon:yes stop_codon:yes gene_type:complete